jgi:hypothetical protein
MKTYRTSDDFFAAEVNEYGTSTSWGINIGLFRTTTPPTNAHGLQQALTGLPT